MTYRYCIQAYDVQGNELRPFDFYSDSLLDKELTITTMFEMLTKLKKQGKVKILDYLDYYPNTLPYTKEKDYLYLDLTADGGEELYVYIKNIKIDSEKM